MRLLFFVLFISSAAFSQGRLKVDYDILEYMQLKADNDTASIASGTVGNGTLKHGKLMPYKGPNFMYFDRESYLEGRAFVHSSVKSALAAAYDSLSRAVPNRYFNIMECSNEEGGEMFPHRTHQNGLSVDFMMPLVKNGKPYYDLDTLGAKHYALEFDDDGKYTKDPEVSVDFDLTARQILIFDHFARKNGLNVAKVIIKIELKDELFATYYGQKLKEKGIYVVHGLSPLINALHDEHFHIDFGFKYPETAPAASSETSSPVHWHK